MRQDSHHSRHSSPKSPNRISQRSSDRGQSNDEKSDSESLDSYFERRELNVDDAINNNVSPGLYAAQGFDIPLYRDKQNDFESLETIISAIVAGCCFGKLCLQPAKDGRFWMYNTIALTDTFLVSMNKNDIFKMVENQRRRILTDQMNFLKAIPSPEFNVISKKKLQNICDSLQTFSCIKGTTIFN